MLLFAIDLIQFVDLHSQCDIFIYNIYSNMTTDKNNFRCLHKLDGDLESSEENWRENRLKATTLCRLFFFKVKVDKIN